MRLFIREEVIAMSYAKWINGQVRTTRSNRAAGRATRCVVAPGVARGGVQRGRREPPNPAA
jgi:hypothetical protein